MKKIDNTNPYIVALIGVIGIALMLLAGISINTIMYWDGLASVGLALIGVLGVVMGAGLTAISIISAFMLIFKVKCEEETTKKEVI
jgi:hypothetical protein